MSWRTISDRSRLSRSQMTGLIKQRFEPEQVHMHGHIIVDDYKTAVMKYKTWRSAV